MTAFSMRCCRGPELRGALLSLCFALAIALPVKAQGIEVRKAYAAISDEAYVVEAQFDIGLTHALEEVLNKGVALYFVLEFELIRPRWYWFDERVAYLQQEYRLSYNALTRQYRVGVANLHQNFATLGEALAVMSHVRRRQDIERGSIKRDERYIAGLRLRLDTSQLPKPFQLTAVGSRDWQIGSDWFRWTLTP
jgi:hypothetical protein